ncbi:MULTISPECIES: hypothetical protein [unclassified Streptomyces]|uniref:hypothetical protein n=1 Tax=unclassified Streptomyces TaxID=2593676 RepID=UPI00340B31DB
MDKQLPAAIEQTLVARNHMNEARPYNHTRQVMTFLYQRGDEAIDLGLFEGPLPIPSVGQAVTLWITGNPLIVTRVETHYGIGQHGEDKQGAQVASVLVFVEPAAEHP